MTQNEDQAGSIPMPATLPPKPAAADQIASMEQAARSRAEQCGREIALALKRHQCRIVPFLLPLEAVGADGSKGLVTASFGIVPTMAE